MDVVGGEVGQGPAAAVFELFPPDPTGGWGQVRVPA